MQSAITSPHGGGFSREGASRPCAGTSRLRQRFIALMLCAGLLASLNGCAGDSSDSSDESYIERPSDVALSIRTIDQAAYNRLSTSEQTCWTEATDQDGVFRQVWGYVPSPATHTVAKLDFCYGSVINQRWQVNPRVVTHIPVGLYPVSAESSTDGKTVLVLNAHQATVSAIDTDMDMVVKTVITLPSQASAMVLAGTDRRRAFFTHPLDRSISMWEASDASLRTWTKTGVFVLPVAGDLACSKILAQAPGTALADAALDKNPVPGVPTPLDADGVTLVIPNTTGDSFLLLDTASSSFTCYWVAGPTAVGAVSPDGKWLYLGKRMQPKVAVVELATMGYVDTNKELPSHEGGVAAPPVIDYDILVSGTPKGIAFQIIHRTFGTKTLTEPTDENADYTESNDVFFVETPDAPPGLFAYVATHAGALHIIDVNNEMHKIFDAYQWEDPVTEEPKLYEDLDADTPVAAIAGGPAAGASTTVKFTKDGFEFKRRRTTDGEWTIVYNGIIPSQAASVSGRLDAARGRFYDPWVDFRSAPILVRDGVRRGDRLAIKTVPGAKCGAAVASSAYSINLEISGIGDEGSGDDPDYLIYDAAGAPDLSNCFTTSVEYELRANDSYIVYATLPGGGSFAYQGRAIPWIIGKGDSCTKESLTDASWSFSNDYLSFIICTVDPKVSSTSLLPAPELFEYSFTTVSEIDAEVVTGGSFVGVKVEPGEDGRVFIVDAGSDSVVVFNPLSGNVATVN